jgi:hypothetical protein
MDEGMKGKCGRGKGDWGSVVLVLWGCACLLT